MKQLKELAAKIQSTRDYENIRTRLGKELGGLVHELVDKCEKINEPSIKIISEEYEEGLFHNYALTDLMLLKKNGRKIKGNENTALHILLIQKLEEYGLSLFGQIDIDGMTFRGVRLLDSFDSKNEEIIKQLYGYEGITVHIQIKGFDDFAAAFDYNVDTGHCQLQRHCWGNITHTIDYDSMKSMLGDLTTKGYHNIFNHPSKG